MASPMMMLLPCIMAAVPDTVTGDPSRSKGAPSKLVPVTSTSIVWVPTIMLVPQGSSVLVVSTAGEPCA